MELCFAKEELIYHKIVLSCGCIVIVTNTNTSCLVLDYFDLISRLDLKIAAVYCDVCIHHVVELSIYPCDCQLFKFRLYASQLSCIANSAISAQLVKLVAKLAVLFNAPFEKKIFQWWTVFCLLSLQQCHFCGSSVQLSRTLVLIVCTNIVR